MNISAIVAIISGFVIILLTQGENISGIEMLLQPEAFFIVVGGTLCATILNYSPAALNRAIYSVKEVFVNEENQAEKIIKQIIALAKEARHHGIFSIYEKSKLIKEPFLKRGIQLAVDIENSQILYDVLENEISYEEEQEIINSRIFEAMGGYAPTFGIVGAVLGLIRIMSDLQDFETVGIGIATAFVATLYGVGLANLVFLPIAGNLKAKIREKILLKEVILQGIMSIHIQESPTVLEEKLYSYLKFHNRQINRLTLKHEQNAQKILGLLTR